MKCTIALKVNREKYHLEVESHRTLLDIIRNEIGLKGTKEGCGEGRCGACTVLMNGKAVNSCLILAVETADSEIITIEGLATGDTLHPIQSSFIKYGAVQCGFCTPGAILSAKALLDKNPHPTESEVRRAIAGNLCRCTGYSKIVEAISRVHEEEKG
jgi:carbon-monoxide dehydrogenase small subunit